MKDEKFNKLLSTLQQLNESLDKVIAPICSDVDYEKIRELSSKAAEEIKEVMNEGKSEHRGVPLTSGKGYYFKGDILITDPCYIMPANDVDDWERSGYGFALDKIGVKTFITQYTQVGDCSCIVKDDKGNKLGQFCADSGLVSVMSLDEALTYNPALKKDIKASTICYTVIKDFDGYIKLVDGNDDCCDHYTSIEGAGNVNFKTYLDNE